MCVCVVRTLSYIGSVSWLHVGICFSISVATSLNWKVKSSNC